MYDFITPKIPKGSKVIVGLGDSFTQGVGSWSKNTYKKYKGKIDIHRIPNSLLEEMYHNSWVHHLCNEYLYDFIPINLGISGTGNRSAVKELYLNPLVNLENASDVIVILLLSGLERFDFVNKYFPDHHHFYTMWPNYWDKNSTNKRLWKCYARDLWSNKFECIECLLNIKEAEMFCKANDYKFIVASAFEQRITKEYFLETLSPHNNLVETIPWGNFLYPNGFKSFMEMLLDFEGRRDLAYGGFYDFYTKLPEPSEYITNCAHPSQKGHQIMAKVFYNHMKENGLV